jgi:hypothetical protein
MDRLPLLVASCSLVALVATGWWLLQRTVEVAPGSTPAGTLATAPHDAVPTTAAEPTPQPTAAPTATERTVAETAAAPAAAGPAGTRRLEGSIVVVDGVDGSRHPNCDGLLQLELRVPVDADATTFRLDAVTVPVVAGRWQADVTRAATRLQIGDTVLDQRVAVCLDDFELADVRAPLLLRALWPRGAMLRVTGADTKADLADIRVVRLRDWSSLQFRHPGNGELQVVVEHGRSPLLLHSESGPTARFGVKAPGYAWEQVHLATDEPGERTVQLVPGGDVDVTFVGAVPDGAVLRVREVGEDEPTAPGLPRRQDQPVAEIALAAAGATRIDALPVGSWSLSLEKGDWFREQVVFGTATVVVTAGAIVPATIVVQADAQPPVTCQVRGTLQLSPDWGADIHLELEPGGATRAWTKNAVQLRLDQMQPIGAGRHQWGEVTLLAGRWEITVHGTGYRTIAEVGPGHPAELHIVVPDPNEVRVRVVDATTGVPIPGATPSWHGSVAGWSSGWSHSRMQAVGDDWYRTLAPAGTIVLSAHAEGYSWSHAEHEVRAGANTFVLRVPRVCGIELVLKDGEVTIPWPDNAYAQIEHTTAKSGVGYWSDNRVAAQQPGEHLLTLEPIPGYEPIPPRKVQIEPEQWTRVEIALRRKP